MKKENKSIQGMAINGKLISVSGLETMNCKGAAGVMKMHRKVVVTTSDNQSFAFHLVNEMAKEFGGKVGDRIEVVFKSQVHVSRGGIIHNNLIMTGYGIYPKMTSEKYSPKITINERLISSEQTDSQCINGQLTAINGGIKPAIDGCKGKETGTGDDYQFLVPAESEKSSTIGTKGVDYPDFDMEADENYHAPNGVWSRMKDRIERMCKNNKGGNYEGVC